ncbi:response regulator transcription factor [Kutzneria viridogrisea]|uniref:DNA-binding NarL/FixJ family response regulator n=1 Tax=Kutzneria viridogrisea TaxID=47990 RepID=A0ABR6BK29_9PSEU|nr:DNA-binding NarL/FixJ family response regulator [Kutzneria viridogrisea]
MTAKETPVIRVLVADDRPAVRTALSTVLRLLPGVAVVATATHQRQVAEHTQREQPEVVLLGLTLPGGDPAELTRRLRAEHPATALVVVGSAPADEAVRAVLLAGAAGYLSATPDREAVVRALRVAVASTSGRRPAPRDRREELTAREIDVLGLVAAGLTNAEIARRLSVSEATVKTHLNHAYTKAGLHSRAEAVRYAKQHGIGPADESPPVS